MKRLSLGLAVAIACSFNSLGQNPLQQGHPVVINFAVPINNDTTNGLLRVISGQMQQGVKNITILISSPGGDTMSAFAAYNILKNLPIELTTVNVGTVDSAAMLIYCAGSHRYSLGGPGIRFLIHGNSVTSGLPMDAGNMDAQLQQLKNLNQMLVQVLSAAAPNKKGEIEKAVASQKILSAEEARDWGFVQQLKEQVIDPGSQFIAVNDDRPIEPPASAPPKYSSITSTVLSVSH